MNYFIFKGIDSRSFPEIIVNELPDIISPKEKITTYDIPGKDGQLHQPLGVYENTSKQIQCTLMHHKNIDLISNWLNGYGEIIFSNQPDRIYKVRIANQIPFQRVALHFRTFVIELECEPYSYLITNEGTIELNKTGSSVLNPTLEIAKPILKIYGTSGDITINGIKFTLKAIDEYVLLDSEIMECYKDNLQKGKDLVGEFPILISGINTFIWSEGITKIVITPRWRNR